MGYQREDVLALHSFVADLVHELTYQMYAQAAYLPVLRRERCVRLFLFRWVERYAGVGDGEDQLLAVFSMSLFKNSSNTVGNHPFVGSQLFLRHIAFFIINPPNLVKRCLT